MIEKLLGEIEILARDTRSKVSGLESKLERLEKENKRIKISEIKHLEYIDQLLSAVEHSMSYMSESARAEVNMIARGES